MNLFFFIIFLAEFPILLFTNEYALAGDYPFSIKLGYTEAITFMNNQDIAIYTVGNANPTTYSLNAACQTKEEKGAIYLNGYYYLSCLTSDNQFQINVYDHNFQNVIATYPASTASPNYYTYNPGSSIRFFIKQSNQVLVGVVWLSSDVDSNVILNLLEINEKEIISSSTYTPGNIARDVDCIYINKFQRIVCAFGYELNAQFQYYKCALNIFIVKDGSIETTSNFKTYDSCHYHHSRKLRLNSDLSESSVFFYYYFVGTDNNAYVSKVEMVSNVEFSFGTPKLVIKGCLQAQDSFDLAEDKFLGYNVFTCVEDQYKKKIKIQLFKIENDEITFYGEQNPENYKIQKTMKHFQ